MSEKIIIKLTIAGNSDGISLETARWLQANRHQAIAAVQDSFKPGIIAHSKASERDLNTARLEALAYHEYRTKVLRAQLYGHLQPSLPSDRNDDAIQLPPSELPTTTQNGNGRSTLDLLDNL